MGGHVARFAQLAPAYGGSLVLRAPFVLATKLWHGPEAIALLLCVANPLAFPAVIHGHPEEILGAVLPCLIALLTREAQTVIRPPLVTLPAGAAS